MDAEGASNLGARAAGLLSLLTGFLHGSAIQEHIEEWWGYGLFFVAASIAQGVYGLVLLALPPRPPQWAGARWPLLKRRLFLLGIAGNLAIIALYAVTRTVGIPLFGPQAGEVEAVGLLDLVTLAAEVALVAWLAWLCLALRPAPSPAAQAS